MWQASGCENEWVCLDFEAEKKIKEIDITFDITERLWSESYIINGDKAAGRLMKEFKLEIMSHGKWQTVAEVKENHIRQRKFVLDENITAQKIRIISGKMWRDGEPARVCEIRVH